MSLQKELIKEASKWVGVTKKESVDVFRKAVDGRATEEAWCAGFVQYCCVAVSIREKAEIAIPASELCTHIWDNTPSKYRLANPEPGALIVWKNHGSNRGHIGIIERVVKDALDKRVVLETIEGNTSGNETKVKGVFRKTRSPRGNTEMRVLGFLRPFK